MALSTLTSSSTSSSTTTTTTTTAGPITAAITVNTSSPDAKTQNIVLDMSNVTLTEKDTIQVVIAGSSVQSAMDGSYVSAITLANSDIENEYGLKLNLDALNYNSYPGTGNTWYDLSDSGFTATLNNCGFSTTNYGGITFNGSSSYADLNTSTLLSGTTPFTIVVAFTSNNGTAGALIGNYGPSYYSNTVWFSNAGFWLNSSSPYFSAGTLAAGTYIIAITRDSLGNTKLYKNGALDSSSTNSASIATSLSWRIGMDINSSSEPINATIYLVRAYNVALSATRISDMYNQLKGRYGLT